MYYAEKVINGVLHYKLTPSASWKACTLEHLTQKVLELQEQIETLNER